MTTTEYSLVAALIAVGVIGIADHPTNRITELLPWHFQPGNT